MTESQGLETRLRTDLPRLANSLAEARPTKSAAAETSGPPVAATQDYAEVVPIHDHPRRRALLVAAATLAICAVGATVLLARDHASDDSIATVPPVVTQPGYWTDTAPAPFDSALDVASVWTGDEVLLFGGHVARNGVANAEQISAAYNPATDTWRQLAKLVDMGPAPKAVWAGDVAVVTTKTGGSVYDPATDSWRDLPDQPGDQARWLAFMQPIWTGSQLYLVGTRQETDPLPNGNGGSGTTAVMEFDLESWTWKSEPAAFSYTVDILPTETWSPNAGSATWTGTDIVVGLADGSFATFTPGSTNWWKIQPPDLGPEEPPTSSPETNPSSLALGGGQAYRVVWETESHRVSVWRIRVGYDDVPRWLQVGSVEIGPTTGSLQAIGGDDEIIVLGLTGHDDRAPLEFDLATGSWRQPVSATADGWYGVTSTWTGTQVFEWGGADPGAQFQPVGTNTGRMWTPSKAADTVTSESAGTATTLSMGYTLYMGGSGRDDQRSWDITRWFGDQQVSVECIDGRQRVEVTFVNLGNAPLEIVRSEIGVEDMLRTDGALTPHSDYFDNFDLLAEATVIGSPAEPGATIQLVADVDGSYQGRVTFPVNATAHLAADQLPEMTPDDLAITSEVLDAGFNLWVGQIQLEGSC